ncbi:acyl-CoA dehydrogenase [Orrella sp. 11846]|uniref:acyl-CoA dehydrogenase n=1 Tax=Orrella sp. 11846 TaxID=3409913 RepID=UPI003B5B7010
MTLLYDAPIEDMRFLQAHVTGLSRLRSLPQFEGITADLAHAILEEAARFANEVIAPLNPASDRQPASLQADQVQTSPGYREAYQKFIKGGWNGLDCSPETGGQGLPQSLSMNVNEMWHSASLSFALCPMLTSGAIHAVQGHASADLQARYLKRLVSGEWTGTMNLTEPQAGSDLAAITTRAVPEDDHYRLFGTKIFITYGDHDLTDNIVHLVLARLPDAPAGIKGISLFLVPKQIETTEGQTVRNDVVCTALEHKVGIHGSPTAVMTFGDNEGAIGYLVGQANQGLFYMFTMMNHARLQVGLQGVAVSQRAFQLAREYAHTRRQGSTLLKTGGQGMIEDHPDVRRLLLTMESTVQAMRALALEAATELDLSTQADAQAAQRAQVRADLLIPVVKGWCTEQAVEITSMAMQVHGGMGYIEETGIGQLWRDARITPIYEGTTAIQANDFVSRKLLRDQGQAMQGLLADMLTVCKALADSQQSMLQTLGLQLQQATDTLQSCLDFILSRQEADRSAVYFTSVPLLMLTGFVAGGWMLGRCALAAMAESTICETTQAQHLKLASAYGQLVLMPALGLSHSILHGHEVLTHL